MRRNRLTVHNQLASHVDILPNLALKTSAHVGFVQNPDPRAESLELLQRVPIMIEPDQKMQMGVCRKLGIPVSSNSAGGRDVSCNGASS